MDGPIVIDTAEFPTARVIATTRAGNSLGVSGSYGLTDVDGRVRVVNYVADGLGFRAAIKTNEPGTKQLPAAATQLLSSGNSVIAGSIQTSPVQVPVAVQVPVLQKTISSVPVKGPRAGNCPCCQTRKYKKAPSATFRTPATVRSQVHFYGINMKTFIAVVAVVGVAYAGIIGASTGTSVSSRAEDGLGNYKFAYSEQHPTGGSWRSEAGNTLGVSGSYGLTDVDGRVRVVNYVADGLGFRAAIKTNEPGTKQLPAAATQLLSSGNSVIAGSIQTSPVQVPVAVQVPVLQKTISSVPVKVPVPVATQRLVATPVVKAAVATAAAPLVIGGWPHAAGW
ncbi:cuticle protein 14-like [Tropilaelaps mercedesae]|uniref:Cuticle protein 14-like n=2 Tax=Tropilaelaps mercedesae TaxID=418985 RepID=A0A1V9X866_9ACAR|nr:cuticle protein 14-like [Tropilaelaps mercedesae]